MNKTIQFIKDNKGFIFSLLALVVCVITGDASVLIAEGPGVVEPTEGGTATEGSEGLQTQMQDQTASVTNIENAGPASDIIEESIDKKVSLFRSEYFPLDTLARQAAYTMESKNMEVKHFHVDSSRVTATTNDEVTEATSTKVTELPVAADDYSLFPKYSTIDVRGINGYAQDGTTATEGKDLMLMVVGKAATGCPMVMCLNGKKEHPEDTACYFPAIASGTHLYRLASACSESQLFVPPATTSPVSETVYMQKKIKNFKFTDYFNNIEKKVTWEKQNIMEQGLWEFRRECEATYLLGRKSKFMFDDPERQSAGPELVYTQEGILWQIKKSYEYTAHQFTFEDFIAISKMKFTGNNGSKTAFFGVGKDLLEDMLNIDYTKHKELTVNSIEKWGIKFNSFVSPFGTFNVVHMPILDDYDLSSVGILLDVDYLVRYYYKPTEEREFDLGVLGEDAKRNVTIQNDCLTLKGYSHMIVKPSDVTLFSGLDFENGMTTATKSATIPADPKEGDVVYLTADAGEFKKGDLIQYNGSSWAAYTGNVYVG